MHLQHLATMIVLLDFRSYKSIFIPLTDLFYLSKGNDIHSRALNFLAQELEHPRPPPHQIPIRMIDNVPADPCATQLSPDKCQGD